MTHYLLLFVAAVFVNNVVLSQFLGICPFLGVSKKVDTAIGMGAAVTFVLALSTMCTFLLQKFVLEPFDMVYMQTISFILVIAALVQMVEIILKKVSPALYQALGVFLRSSRRTAASSGSPSSSSRRNTRCWRASSTRSPSLSASRSPSWSSLVSVSNSLAPSCPPR